MCAVVPCTGVVTWAAKPTAGPPRANHPGQPGLTTSSSIRRRQHSSRRGHRQAAAGCSGLGSSGPSTCECRCRQLLCAGAAFCRCVFLAPTVLHCSPVNCVKQGLAKVYACVQHQWKLLLTLSLQHGVAFQSACVNGLSYNGSAADVWPCFIATSYMTVQDLHPSQSWLASRAAAADTALSPLLLPLLSLLLSHVALPGTCSAQAEFLLRGQLLTLLSAKRRAPSGSNSNAIAAATAAAAGGVAMGALVSIGHLPHGSACVGQLDKAGGVQSCFKLPCHKCSAACIRGASC